MLYEVITGTNNDGAVEMQAEVAVACKIAWDGSEQSATNFKKVATNYFTRGSKFLYTNVITSYSIHYTKLYDFR